MERGELQCRHSDLVEDFRQRSDAILFLARGAALEQLGSCCTLQRASVLEAAGSVSRHH